MKEYVEGKQAYNAGVELTENPYDYNTQAAVNWANGWLQTNLLEMENTQELESLNTLHY